MLDISDDVLMKLAYQRGALALLKKKSSTDPVVDLALEKAIREIDFLIDYFA